MFSRGAKVSFQVTLTIGELTNVPLLTGVIFAKYKLKNGGSCKGETTRGYQLSSTLCKLRWLELNDAKSVRIEVPMEVSMTIGRDTGVLSDCIFWIVIKKEINGGQDSENLGLVNINISEYAASRESSRSPEIPKNQLDFSNLDELINHDTEEAASKASASGSSLRVVRGGEYLYPTNGSISPREDNGAPGVSLSLPIRPNTNRIHGLANSLGLGGNKNNSMTLPRTPGTLTPSSSSGAASGEMSPSTSYLRSPNRFSRIATTPTSPARSDATTSPGGTLPRRWNAEDIVDVAFSGKGLNID